MHPLDNIIWQALTTRQSEFAECLGSARRFVPEISALGGFAEPTPEDYESLARLVGTGGTIRLFLETPYQPRAGWSLVAGTPMLEMVYEGSGTPPISRICSNSEIVELGGADSADMMELTALTKPGPFSPRTHELGIYLGIRREGKLIAMAGERLKVPGHTEVSAVCTHPEHVGHGYARSLMIEVMRGICSRRETPFLHVREANVHAIALYYKLGFSRRVLLHHAVLQKL
jgi:ribosomal protein S18 acetylase RimI-like enzyme